MSVEVLPLSMRCNLRCTYCYENAVRDAETVAPYDMPAMKRALTEEMNAGRRSDGFTVFGGEPLMVPIADFEELLRHSFETSGQSGVQTNASMITDGHLELFRRYNTHVGVSIDGPGVLNDARRGVSQEATRRLTEKSVEALDRLLTEKIGCSLIVTLHKLNAVGDSLRELVVWLRGLAENGLRHVRLHMLEVDSREAEHLRLTEDEAVAALIALHREEPKIGVEFDLFREMLALLRGKDEAVTCIWNACDPATTPAVRGVGPRGERLNCARTNKDGVNWVKADRSSHHRQIALYATPFEHGGCQGCRFFVMCKGQCPGEAIDGDPRNRSANCQVWFRVLTYLEQVLVYAREAPVSLRPDRQKIEDAMLFEWERGRQVSVARGMFLAAGGARSVTSGVDSHGDSPHGDSHGDHIDVGVA